MPQIDIEVVRMHKSNGSNEYNAYQSVKDAIEIAKFSQTKYSKLFLKVWYTMYVYKCFPINGR